MFSKTLKQENLQNSKQRYRNNRQKSGIFYQWGMWLLVLLRRGCWARALLECSLAVNSWFCPLLCCFRLCRSVCISTCACLKQRGRIPHWILVCRLEFRGWTAECNSEIYLSLIQIRSVPWAHQPWAHRGKTSKQITHWSFMIIPWQLFPLLMQMSIVASSFSLKKEENAQTRLCSDQGK